MKKSNLIFFSLIGLIVIAGLIVYNKKRPHTDVPGYATATPKSSSKPGTSSPAPNPSVSKPSTPGSLSLKVPFTAQAPTGNWDQLHNEACEEASALMVAAYFSGDTREKLPASEVEQSISMLTNWQNDHFGYSLDTTAAETAQMIESVYHLKTQIIKNYTEDDIKKALQENKLVIIPANGRLLGNPNYKQPGPIYHMLVIRGYTSSKIITNDSGTRNGENYSYSFSTIKNAPADWNHSTDTIDPTSLMIVVSK